MELNDFLRLTIASFLLVHRLNFQGNGLFDEDDDVDDADIFSADPKVRPKVWHHGFLAVAALQMIFVLTADKHYLPPLSPPLLLLPVARAGGCGAAAKEVGPVIVWSRG